MDDLINTSKRSELKKTLNVFDLIVIGIGAVVGTGIFTIIGTAITGSSESAGAGPAIVVSMVLAAVACVFSALCYSEIAAMIPVAGSAYTYTYATVILPIAYSSIKIQPTIQAMNSPIVA